MIQSGALLTAATGALRRSRYADAENDAPTHTERAIQETLHSIRST